MNVGDIAPVMVIPASYTAGAFDIALFAKDNTRSLVSRADSRHHTTCTCTDNKDISIYSFYL
jgi:hypothetical protein